MGWNLRKVGCKLTREIIIDIEKEYAEILEEELFENFNILGIVSSYERFKEFESVSMDERLKIYVEEAQGIIEYVNNFRELLIKRSCSPKIWQIENNEIKDCDWSAEWKKHWKPSKISSKFVVVPSWEKYERKEDETVIEIDPSNAFGTGAHATTQLCVQMIEENIKVGDSVIDLGTGSGILAICAKICGANEVFAIDNDQTVIDTAKENAKRNNCKIKFEHSEIEPLKGQYDFVVANILHNIIADNMKELKRLAMDNGKLILSGILDSKADVVFQALELNGLKVLEIKKQDCWIAILAQK